MDGREDMAPSGSGTPISLPAPSGIGPLSNPNISVQSNVRVNSVDSTFQTEIQSPKFPPGINMGISTVLSPGDPGKRKGGRRQKYRPDAARKRGRPRKCPPDEAIMPTKKPGRGRPPGSGRKPKLASLGTPILLSGCCSLVPSKSCSKASIQTELPAPPGFRPLSNANISFQSNVREGSVGSTFQIENPLPNLAPGINMIDMPLGLSTMSSTLSPGSITATQKRRRGRPHGSGSGSGSGRLRQLASLGTRTLLPSPYNFRPLPNRNTLGKRKLRRPQKYSPYGASMSLGTSPISLTLSPESIRPTQKLRRSRLPRSGRKQQLAFLGPVKDIYGAGHANQVVKDEAMDTEVSPVFDQAGDLSSIPNLEDTQSITSSLLNWATAFDDVLNTGPSTSVDNMMEVGSYSVEPSLSPTLQAIIKKYGDIAKDCPLQSKMIRSSLLESICKVLQGLQIPVKYLSPHDLKTYYSVVKDADHLGLDVKWLLQRLDEASEMIHLIRQWKDLRDAREKRMELMDSTKKALELKKAEEEKLECEIKEVEDQLRSDTLEVERVKTAIRHVADRCKYFPQKCLMDGLF